MAAAHTAQIVDDGDDTIVRVSGKLHLQPGPVLLQEDDVSKNIILSPLAKSSPHLGDWEGFFRFMQATEVPESFMADRPMNAPSNPRGVFDDE